MIIIKTYKDEWNPMGWYVAKSTKFNKMVTGDTRKNALTNLRNIVREEIKRINKNLIRVDYSKK